MNIILHPILCLSCHIGFWHLCDFNTEPTDTTLSNFCEIYNLKNPIKDKTCFKNPDKTTCIDLIITNRPKSFQNSMVIETGLSDFHKMCIAVMKIYYSKQKPSIIHCRKFMVLTIMLLYRILRHSYQNQLIKK